MSSKNRSAKAMCVNPSATARSTTPRIACSYASFEQGEGSGTVQTGRASAAAWAARCATRTACIATPWAAWLIVVTTPPTSTSARARSTCIIHALSLPLLQETIVFNTGDSTDTVSPIDERLLDQLNQRSTTRFAAHGVPLPRTPHTPRSPICTAVVVLAVVFAVGLC